jgi:hypothetical protein
MSFKITKARKIQEWLEETVWLVKPTLEGEKILIDLRKLPLQLKERIVVAVRYTRALNNGREGTHEILRKILENDTHDPNKSYRVNVASLLEAEKGYVYEYSWTGEAPFPLVFKKYLEFVLKSLSTFIEESENTPINIEERISGGWKTGGTWAGTGWAYKGYIHQFEYKNQPPYSSEEEELLLLEQYDLERQKFEKLKRKHKSGNIETESYKRERISEEVRIAVWRRDDGKCARCGSRENLEYDHIVPVSKGGGNTARNIELLCESCNRKKSNKIE